MKTRVAALRVRPRGSGTHRTIEIAQRDHNQRRRHELRYTRRNPRDRHGVGGLFMGWMDHLMARRIVRRVFSTFGFDVLVLSTIGRKSGIERTSQVCWFPGKDGSWLIVAAAGGTRVNPAWYYNIAAHPDEVQIEIDRELPVIRLMPRSGSAAPQD
jgi:deazaflavin-dependent oxidoreductase (nitroreductase family)